MNMERFSPAPEAADFAPVDLAPSRSLSMIPAIASTSTAPLKAEKDFFHAISQPYGMVLVTGPTGSGKTTTLYSALSRINTDEVNIMTAEDPVEYNLHGINQVLVRNEIGMTFAAALKAFQGKQGLEPTGELDEATVDALREAYGS